MALKKIKRRIYKFHNSTSTVSKLTKINVIEQGIIILYTCKLS